MTFRELYFVTWDFDLASPATPSLEHSSNTWGPVWTHWTSFRQLKIVGVANSLEVGLSGFLMERSQQGLQQCGILRPICALASRCAEIGNTTKVNIWNVSLSSEFQFSYRYINLLDVVMGIKLGIRFQMNPKIAMVIKPYPSWSCSNSTRGFRAELWQLSKCSQACGGCVRQPVLLNSTTVQHSHCIEYDNLDIWSPPEMCAG